MGLLVHCSPNSPSVNSKQPDLCENKPSVGRQPEPAFGRLAATQCRAHGTNQEGIGAQAKGEIKNDDRSREVDLISTTILRPDFVRKNCLQRRKKGIEHIQ